jgi:hypothetical protein
MDLPPQNPSSLPGSSLNGCALVNEDLGVDSIHVHTCLGIASAKKDEACRVSGAMLKER